MLAYVQSTGFFNWAGKDGASMHADRGMEMFNHVQGDRGGTFASFDSAFEFTPFMKALMHVVQAMDVAENGESESSDPLRQQHINAAQVRPWPIIHAQPS